MSRAGEGEPEVDDRREGLAERVESLTAAAYARGDTALLEPLRESVAAIGDAVGARENRAIAGALLVIYKLSHLLDELAVARAALERVQTNWPTAAAANNLASALLETVRRGEAFRDADTDDAADDVSSGQGGAEQRRAAVFWRAVELLRSVIPPEVTEVAWVTRSTTLLSGLVDGLQLGIRGVGVEDVLAEARRLLDGMERRGGEDPEALNLIASTMLAAADIGHPDGDLDLAVELLQRSLVLTEPDHLDRPARVGNLAAVLIDRFERGVGGRDDLDRALSLAREAVADLDDADPRQLAAINVLTNGLVASWQYFGDDEKLHEALSHLALFIAHVRVVGPPAAAFMENAALLAYHGARTFRDDDSDDLLAVAIDLFEQSLRAADPGTHAWATRQGALGAVLAELYHRTRRIEDLDAATDAARYAVEGARAVTHEWAIHATTLGNLLHDRFLLTGQVAILDESAALQRQALSVLVDEAPGTASFLNNIAIVSNERYERFGRIEDLRLGVESIERALAASPDGMRDQGARCNNAALMLLALFHATGDARHLARAAALARAGAEICDALGDRLTARVCLGTLSDALQTQAFGIEANTNANTDAGTDTSNAAAPTAGIVAGVDMHAVTRPDTGVPGLGSVDALDSLRCLWAERAEDLVSGTGSVLATRLIRQARLPAAVVGELDRIGLLLEAARLARAGRPAVGLAAAREALALLLDERCRGRATGADARAVVDMLVDTAFGSLDALVASNQDWADSLTWLRDARGTGALAAQLRLMDGDLSGAVTAFERGHALLLGRVMNARDAAVDAGDALSGRGPIRHQTRGGAGDSVQQASGRDLTLYVWAAPGGGGAVMTEGGDPKGASILPTLTSRAAGAMRVAISRAPHLGPAAMDKAVEQVGIWLGDVLAPYEDLLRNDGVLPHLTICAGGVMGSMPWAATRLPGGALLDEQAVLYAAPTGVVAGRCASVAAEWIQGERVRDLEVLSLAAPSPTRFPRLKRAVGEGLAFAGREGLRSGPSASRANAAAAQRETRVLHFACHGMTAANDPLANHLLLAHDEPWYASEILTCDRSPRLVVLSACETATVSGVHADEGLGLASAFLAAGTPGVVASLWSVGDLAAATFIGLAAAGLRDPARDPAVVLREARATQRAAGIGASGWAAFTFVGR